MSSLSTRVSLQRPATPRRTAAVRRRLAHSASPVDSVSRSNCACGGGCPRCNGQKSTLRLSPANDYAEREADHAADSVLRNAPSARTRVQRHPATAASNDSHLPSGLSRRIEGMAGQGQPLGAPVRRFFEHRLGADFGAVRVHTGNTAAETARALNAEAYTIGNDISFAPGRYDPRTVAGGHLLAHELAHVVQQRGGTRRVQRAQIDRVHTPASGTPYFLYELDATMSRFAQLASYYGVTVAQISSANPGVSATRLRLGDQVRVPALNPPTGPAPLGPPAGGLIQSTATLPIAVRWNTGSNDNRIGRAPRGTAAGIVGGGVYMALTNLQNVAQGLVDEMRERALTTNGDVYGYVPAANLRSTMTAPAASDVDLIARMIWGEQRSQGDDAMAAAAWIAKNRYNAGWGSYSQIITRPQFHGLATPAAVTGLTGPDAAAWTEAQRIAQQVVDGAIADPTGGALFFGNDVAGARVLARMRDCATRNPRFSYGRIGATNFYYSNGDYTAAACTVP
jgi:hypothetical protein